MKSPLEIFKAMVELIIGPVAEELLEPLGIVDVVRAHFPIPEPFHAAFDCAGKTLFPIGELSMRFAGGRKLLLQLPQLLHEFGWRTLGFALRGGRHLQVDATGLGYSGRERSLSWS
jgi:hypothetical protein